MEYTPLTNEIKVVRNQETARIVPTFISEIHIISKKFLNNEHLTTMNLDLRMHTIIQEVTILGTVGLSSHGVQ